MTSISGVEWLFTGAVTNGEAVFDAITHVSGLFSTFSRLLCRYTLVCHYQLHCPL